MFLLHALLNRINMYRLAIYYLASLFLLAVGLSFSGVLPYDTLDIVLSGAYLVGLSLGANIVFARVIHGKANHESAIITGLILALIVGPVSFSERIVFLSFLALAAMASKYVFVWRKKHIFNPAGFAVLAAAVFFGQGASWWVGSFFLLPAVFFFGLVLLQKIGRWFLAGSFLAAYLSVMVVINASAFSSVADVAGFLWGIVAFTPLLFFMFVMLPEPQTSPKRKKPRIWYGVFTAVTLAGLQTYVPVPYTLEFALIIGNVFSRVVSSDMRVVFSFAGKEQIAPAVYNFWFSPRRPFSFAPGQFLEWTVYHKDADSRGIRRYFTIASSPTESDILVSAKVPEEASTFKQALMRLHKGEEVTAVGVEGEFILPKDTDKKLVFIAGGIGITPFRSMIKHLLDTGEKRDIVLVYAAARPDEFVFTDVFTEAQEQLGLKTVYTVSDSATAPSDWRGETGLVDADLIKRTIPGWEARLFYVSGPDPMVRAVAGALYDMGVPRSSVKRDYFPGYGEI